MSDNAYTLTYLRTVRLREEVTITVDAQSLAEAADEAEGELGDVKPTVLERDAGPWELADWTTAIREEDE